MCVRTWCQRHELRATVVLTSSRATMDESEEQVLFQEVMMLTLIITSPMSHPGAG